MTDRTAAELRSIVEELDRGAKMLSPKGRQTIEWMRAVLLKFDSAWSGSQFGYQANVYYSSLETPAKGDFFSVEWGFQIPFAGGTKGSWKEFQPDEIFTLISQKAGNANLAEIGNLSADAGEIFLDGQSALESILSLIPSENLDTYVQDCRERARSLAIPEIADLRNRQIRVRTVTIRDVRAANGGTVVAPHQAFRAGVDFAESAFILCRQLSKICSNLARHFERSAVLTPTTPLSAGTKVFIGHGQSPEWLKLKDFVTTRLGFECDVFTQVPTAGETNIHRLTTMLENATIGLIVMTAEDESADGEKRARENVVHEAGLFQGRLGFNRAIVFVEDSCNVFSNIEGLGQLRFPRGQIETQFEELRRVFEREGLLSPERNLQ